MSSARAPHLGRVWWVVLGTLGVAGAISLAFATGRTQPDQVFLSGCLGLIVLAVALVVGYVDLAWTVSAAVVLAVFAGNWEHLGLPGFPFLPDRLLLIASLGAVLLGAPSAAGRPAFRRRADHWVAALAIAFVTIDAYVAHTLTSNSGLFKLVDRFGIFPFLLFAVAPIVYPTAHHRRILLGFLVGLGAYLGLTALFTVTGTSGLVFPRYILNPNLGLGDLDSTGQAIGRARGPFLDAVSNGLAMFDCGVAAALGVVVFRRRWVRLVSAMVVLLSVLGCLFTLQRTVWLATILAVLVAMASDRRLRRLIVPTGAALAVAVVASFVLSPTLHERAVTRFNDHFTVFDRQNLSAAGVRMLAERPLLGFGWDTFAKKSAPYIIQSPDYPLTAHGRVIHNTFLSNAVELGVIGALLWLVATAMFLLGPLLRRPPPEWRTALVAVVVFWAVTAWLYPLVLAFPMTFVMLWAGVVDGTAEAVPVTPGGSSSAAADGPTESWPAALGAASAR
ncbi:MAG: O-antigen ligase family protein [Solirubrobacteraceae bacterium]